MSFNRATQMKNSFGCTFMLIYTFLKLVFCCRKEYLFRSGRYNISRVAEVGKEKRTLKIEQNKKLEWFFPEPFIDSLFRLAFCVLPKWPIGMNDYALSMVETCQSPKGRGRI